MGMRASRRSCCLHRAILIDALEPRTLLSTTLSHGVLAITGGAGKETLHGGPGKDNLKGGGSNDEVLGEAGNDVVYGGPGNDRVDGGLGFDQVSGDDGTDTVAGGQSGDTVNPDAGEDTTISGTDIGTMSGEIRGKDGRIDIKATINSLVKMGVNTYYYLVWHNVHDWDAFPALNNLA